MLHTSLLHADVLRLKSRRLDDEDMEGLAGSPERPSSPVSRSPSPRATERCGGHSIYPFFAQSFSVLILFLVCLSFGFTILN